MHSELASMSYFNVNIWREIEFERSNGLKCRNSARARRRRVCERDQLLRRGGGGSDSEFHGLHDARIY